MSETLLERLRRHAESNPDTTIAIYPGDALEIVNSIDHLTQEMSKISFGVEAHSIGALGRHMTAEEILAEWIFLGNNLDESENERDEAQARAERLAKLLQSFMDFQISPTFDAKASYTERKSLELIALQNEVRAALAASPAPTAPDAKVSDER